ncbi:glycosyltransferase family 2 protein [Hominisplanchenecus murintestinalis]|uniref:glycosyltransferase family 2 protein n=1 Tax=Hominisplanchenecus murintestinalis TaxID=2941517 RepID=UPI00203CF1A7|nr:glycosyltransferase family 2 protein [Hominisplanchenecus murintestinalis]MDE6907338.1 glycosyltransferase family 2 protein [Lachnospiraceae bacterium]
MKKIAIIPAYNEQDSIVKTVTDLQKKAPDFDYIIINDCSKDNTMDICREHGLKVLNLPINLGIGGAVQTGYLYAYKYKYDIAVQFDGDGQHDAVYLEAMSKVLEKEQNDMVIGSRFITKEGFQSSGLRRVGIRYFAFLTKLLFGQKITDATSGMRMCNRKVMKLFIKDYPRDYPEPESVARLLRYKCRIKEIPVVMHEREAGVSSISLKKSGYYMIKVSLAILIERLR